MGLEGLSDTANRLERQAALLIEGTASGARDALMDAVFERPGTTAGKLTAAGVAGFAFSTLCRRFPLLKLSGVAFAATWAAEFVPHAKTTWGAMSDTWHNPENFERNKQVVADSMGPALVTGGLSFMGAGAGGRLARVPSVTRATDRGLDYARSYLPSRVNWYEDGMLAALHKYHPDSYHHSRRVEQLATLIGREMGYRRPELKELSHAAKMHDIGKLDVPLSILGKRGQLLDSELPVMQSHAAHTFRRLSEVPYPRHMRETPRIAGGHHEFLDGSGYPNRWKGSEIPRGSQIIKVADELDALTQVRGYKPRFEFDRVVSILESEVQAGKVDGQVMSALRRLPADGIVRIIESAPGRPLCPACTGCLT